MLRHVISIEIKAISMTVQSAKTSGKKRINNKSEDINNILKIFHTNNISVGVLSKQNQPLCKIYFVYR